MEMLETSSSGNILRQTENELVYSIQNLSKVQVSNEKKIIFYNLYKDLSLEIVKRCID